MTARRTLDFLNIGRGAGWLMPAEPKTEWPLRGGQAEPKTVFATKSTSTQAPEVNP